MAVGSILALIVLMALAMSLRYWLKKSASLSRTENSITSPGFDNITFSDVRKLFGPSVLGEGIFRGFFKGLG